MSQLVPYLSLKWIHRYHEDNPSREYLDDLVKKYDLHEIIEEDLEESSTQDKIDVYDECLFIVLHFPKYDLTNEKYVLNEFNIILAKDSLVTLTKYKTSHIEKIKQKYEQDIAEKEDDEDFKISPYYILYRVIDIMYDKLLRSLRLFTKDIRAIEEKIFSNRTFDKNILEKVMKKRRNLIILKHAILPQQEILQELQEETLKLFWWELDVYFEDLESKIDKILSTISMLDEDIESLYNIYDALVNMKTNSIMTVLTIFTAIMWVLTLITGWYGMNVPLVWADNPLVTVYIAAGMVFISLAMLLFFQRKRRI